VGHKEESNAVLRGSLMMATERQRDKERNRERNRKYDGHFGLNSVSVCAVTEKSRQDRSSARCPTDGFDKTVTPHHTTSYHSITQYWYRIE
jgi:hypothetical protein